jgi:D-serine/D-alanine/glycine transporter
MGFFAGFQIAVFAFVGIELVGTTAAETENPSAPAQGDQLDPDAHHRVLRAGPGRDHGRDPVARRGAGKSPFVELFVLAGLPAAAGIINFVVLTSAASSANSGVFSTSRMLFGLAEEGDAPKAFGAVAPCGAGQRPVLLLPCLLLGAVLIYLVPDVVEAFTLVTTVSAVLFMFVWSLILLSYLSYRKTARRCMASSYKMPGGRFMCWVCLVFFAGILVLRSLRDDTRQALVVTPPWFVLLA